MPISKHVRTARSDGDGRSASAADRLRGIAILVALALPCLAGPAVAQTGELVDRTELRVCADPSNLPFSNERGEGFENRIAGLIGETLHLPVSYVWFPQSVGFVRNTLRARRCDLVMGTAAGDELMQNTNPYYYTTYVRVQRRDSGLDEVAIDDPKLKELRIGVVAGTPPADLLVRHGLMANARPYALVVDTRFESPARQMVLDVAEGRTDLAFAWGPIAGYVARREKLPLVLLPVGNEPQVARMDYRITMGVRANEPEWRRSINAAIRERQPEITAILRDYGVPLLDEQGRLLPP